MASQEMSLKEVFENPKSVFSILSPEEKEDLQKHITLSNYKKNEFIFKEGDTFFTFMVGRLSVTDRSYLMMNTFYQFKTFHDDSC